MDSKKLPLVKVLPIFVARDPMHQIQLAECRPTEELIDKYISHHPNSGERNTKACGNKLISDLSLSSLSCSLPYNHSKVKMCAKGKWIATIHMLPPPNREQSDLGALNKRQMWKAFSKALGRTS